MAAFERLEEVSREKRLVQSLNPRGITAGGPRGGGGGGGGGGRGGVRGEGEEPEKTEEREREGGG